MKNKNTHHYTLAFLLFVFLFPLFSFNPPTDKPAYRIRTIVIDPGHGGHDGATRGAIAREKDVALQVALKLGKQIERELKDVKVIYTRKTDVFVKLYERIEIANANNADLFISIHCNSMPKRAGNERVSGTETFVSGYNRLGEQDVAMRENASMLLEENYEENYDFDPTDPESLIIFRLMKNQFRDQSIRLASLVQDQFATSGRINRGVKEQSLAVLARAGMPAILTEIGFISNPTEERYMTSEKGQAEIVDNLATAIKNYKNLVER